MIKIFRSSFKVCLALLLVLSLGACSSGGAVGLEPFTSPDGRYGFLYPVGWTRVAVKDGPDVVFHDLINSDETLSLVVSKLESDIDLKELGSAEDVGKRLVGEVSSSEVQDREVELLDTKEREFSGHTFYDLEYSVHLPQKSRHEFATVALDRGYLYTLAASSSESRWPKVKDLYKRVLNSFTFLI